MPGDVLLKLPIHLFGGVAAQRAGCKQRPGGFPASADEHSELGIAIGFLMTL